MAPGINGIGRSTSSAIDEDLNVIILTTSVEGHLGDEDGAFDYHQAVQEHGCWSSSATRYGDGCCVNRSQAEHPEADWFASIIGRSPRSHAGVRPDHPGGAEPIDDSHSGREQCRQELVARAITPTSRSEFVRDRTRQPAAGSPQSTLFGHVRARSPAVYPKKDVRPADRRHLLRQISNVPLETQAKLRVIRSDFMRLGAWRRSRSTSDHRGDQRRPAPHDGGREVPRGSVCRLRHFDSAAAAARRKDDIRPVHHFLEKYGERTARFERCPTRRSVTE
jgi:hypothetical protein